jgi:hypothetical protein
MLARLTPPCPAFCQGAFPPVFGNYQHPLFSIRNGSLITSVTAWARGDCHACASIFRTVTWRWNGHSFVPNIS